MTTTQESPSPSTTPTKRIGFTEFLTTPSETYKRRVGTHAWLPVSSDSLPIPSTSSPDFKRPDWFTLSLVRFNQFPEEPLHWSLVISPTDDPGPLIAPYVSSVENAVLRATFILEVRGEPEQMFYHEIKVHKHVSLLEDVHSTYELATFGVGGLGDGGEDDAFGRIMGVARGMEPPKARNRREAKEHCQGWCRRVVEELVLKGVVKEEKVGMLSGMMEAVNPV
ncbi:hypothetical protein K505DRAFT_329899 [Melanomma pulvis-pyrius CBS 109.77]|uniref:Uncharacterized protein n=1 Tax=Melanomma pulvis-pyrius CBS 109.77 TaxID=1314802 RepID=A0A6A6WT46_9PLEO|nr:hypothetical protein K505DRAFT_329899 [Melanomma pulvis-pyrius CBS 109.77]